MTLSHWFLPHKHTHQKAHLISWEAILIYTLLFMLLQVSFNLAGYFKPGILGISGDIGQKKIIELTNIERQKLNLPFLKENSALDSAAKAKAVNMFSEDYWAHFAPSGKTPWDFILGSGYNFSYAGENLAKNFYSEEEVMVAWMNSSAHRENIVNAKYQEIGLAVVEGVLNGQKTTLVVQMFGTTRAGLASASEVSVSGKSFTVSKAEYSKPILLSPQVESRPSVLSALIDPYQVSKIFGLGVIFLMGSLLFIDFMILRKRGILRLTSHHLAHFSLLSVTATALITGGPGSIL